MKFKSIKGVWFPQDEATKQELEAQGIDHLGIHTSEDPYLKSMEAVTGIDRKELASGQHNVMMQQMLGQMNNNQAIMMMVLAGDKEGAMKMLADAKAVTDKKDEAREEASGLSAIDQARAEFDASMRTDESPFKKVPEKTADLVDLPQIKEDAVVTHAEVVTPATKSPGVKSGFQERGYVDKIKKEAKKAATA